MPVTILLQLLDLRTHLAVGGNVRRVIDLGRDRLHLIPQRRRILVDELHFAGLIAQAHDFLRHLEGSLAALRVVPGMNDLHAELRHALDEKLRFLVRVLGA